MKSQIGKEIIRRIIKNRLWEFVRGRFRAMAPVSRIGTIIFFIAKYLPSRSFQLRQLIFILRKMSQWRSKYYLSVLLVLLFEVPSPVNCPRACMISLVTICMYSCLYNMLTKFLSTKPHATSAAHRYDTRNKYVNELHFIFTLNLFSPVRNDVGNNTNVMPTNNNAPKASLSSFAEELNQLVTEETAAGFSFMITDLELLCLEPSDKHFFGKTTHSVSSLLQSLKSVRLTITNYCLHYNS